MYFENNLLRRILKRRMDDLIFQVIKGMFNISLTLFL